MFFLKEIWSIYVFSNPLGIWRIHFIYLLVCLTVYRCAVSIVLCFVPTGGIAALPPTPYLIICVGHLHMEQTLHKLAWFSFPFDTFFAYSHLKFTGLLGLFMHQFSFLYMQNYFDLFQASFVYPKTHWYVLQNNGSSKRMCTLSLPAVIVLAKTFLFGLCVK